ncbi:BrnT family toxin [Synechococcales cyanobacterium C]|uniref:BrnT family toxin n=1 Tax=Petrachloros mirabilis ULC683 TaxID=2781853 RepID=A0A8K2A8Y7_9CYAN|nr:BrnT family toxin [Petrachloros mirabilis]NCJ07689.1 BrnT family toxin [Petrachloros mirabilis ULC683]
MINWTQITGFQWDAGNARKSVDKHGVRQSEAEQVFFNQPLVVLLDLKHSQEEVRYHALGITDENRYLHITFTLRGGDTLIRVISARDMHRRERASYEQHQKDSQIPE